MTSILVRASLLAAVATFLTLGFSVSPPVHAQQAPADVTPDLAAQGEWDAGTNYVTDDLVVARGSTWRAKQANNNRLPGSTSPNNAQYWELFARGFNPLGAWSNATTYQADDLVTSSGSTWRAKKTNINKLPVAGVNWEQFAAVGAAGPNTGIGAGTASVPSISFNGDSNTGIYSPAPDKIAMVENGVLFLHNIGNYNTALGAGALSNNTAYQNTAVGFSALAANTNGGDNTAIGREALAANTSGTYNVAVGGGALLVHTTGDSNTALGAAALKFDQTSSFNTAVGASALNGNHTGSSNTAVGRRPLFTNTTGSSNVALGSNALGSNMAGSGNVAVGVDAGIVPTNSNNSIFIGNAGLAADTTTIKIGTQGTQNKTFIAGIAGIAVTNNAAVLINTTTGQLGTVVSSRRYKEDIAPMPDMSAMLAKLRPVTFHYKPAHDDGAHELQYGLIAEEVAETLPYLTVFNQDGAPETVKYHLLPSFLLAGYQAQQKTIDKQAEKIEALSQSDRDKAAQIAALEARLRNIEAMLPVTQVTRAAAR